MTQNPIDPIPLKIMDVSLRDGGYVVGHQFHRDLVRNVVSCLDEAGIAYIEIGHGISIGASHKVIAAAETDSHYAQAAGEVKKKAKVGMIALPALATEEDLETLRPYLDFIRVGSNIDEIEKAERLILHAKKLNYEVFLQMIRSSRVPPLQIAQSAKIADQMGVDVIYLVDSAGSWSPWDIGPVVTEVKKATQKPLGFHAHNHLGVALANSLIAIQEGCSWVDASLRGVGRGAGNVPLELLLVHLERKGVIRPEHSIDLGVIETAAALILEHLSLEKRGTQLEDYLPASCRIDLYPWALYMRIAEMAGVEIRSLTQALAQALAERNAVEISPADILRGLRQLGVSSDSEIEPIASMLGITD